MFHLLIYNMQQMYFEKKKKKKKAKVETKAQGFQQ